MKRNVAATITALVLVVFVQAQTNTFPSSGNVGIGTLAPVSLLDVNGNSTFRNYLTLDLGSLNRRVELRDNGIFLSNTSDGQFVSNITADGDMFYNTRNSHFFYYNGNLALAIKDGGNVGIGTSNPTGKLHVVGNYVQTSSTFGGGFSISHGGNNSITFTISGSGAIGAFMKAGPGNIVDFIGQQIQSLTRGAYLSSSLGGYALQTLVGNVVLNTTSGNTLIGTTTDNGNKLQVNGAARVENGISAYKPFSAGARIAEFGEGPNAPQAISMVYGSSNDFVTLNIGNSFSLNRLGGGTPLVKSGLSGLALSATDFISLVTNSGKPAELRLPGDYSVGLARFGAYNTSGSQLIVGNSYNNYQFVQITSFQNGRIQVTDNTSAVKAILTETGSLGLGVATPSAQLHTTGTVRFSGLANDNTQVRILVSDANGNVSYRDAATLAGSSSSTWALGGNSVGGNSALGTTSNFDLPFIANSTEWMRITAAGNVGIGTPSPQAKLAVNGDVFAKKVKVTQTGWPDFVFGGEYSLPSLADLENYILKNHHLPDIPAAGEIEKNGVDLGENQSLLLKKIEELTLYVIELSKQNQKLAEEVEKLKQKSVKDEH